MLALKFLWAPDPVAISLGSFNVYYYSLMFVIAFASGLYLMKFMYKKENISLEYLDPLLMYMVVGTLVGARLGEVFFYNWDYFQNNLLEIILPVKITAEGWEFVGFRGLASHGAVVGILSALYLYTKKYKYASMLWLLDRVAITVAFGGVFIRIGNFFNSEIVGKYTGSSFGVVFKNKGETLPRHPVQLYESLGYLIVFILLFLIYKTTQKRNQKGFLIGAFFSLLFSVRFIAEFVKESQGGFGENLGYFSTGQWLSIPLIFLGLVVMALSYKNKASA
ncbi:MAG: Prolipoprotein diacylglyceryl transferase [Bacteroidota bacterium]|nr:MAG: Prolipoprotein diacylglyceryl transferase [Bacteroidota bacterium]